jgi:hypothetical protein
MYLGLTGTTGKGKESVLLVTIPEFIYYALLSPQFYIEN